MVHIGDIFMVNCAYTQETDMSLNLNTEFHK
jgi:hypothetical protein